MSTPARTQSKRRFRRGLSLVEIIIASALLALVLVPVLEMFSTSVRQTQGVRSHLVARAVADWAISQAQAFVASGMAMSEDGVVLTQDVRQVFAATAAQLQDLQVVRSVRQEAPGAGLSLEEASDTESRLWRITVRVRWRDPGLTAPREVVVEVLERAEV